MEDKPNTYALAKVTCTIEDRTVHSTFFKPALQSWALAYDVNPDFENPVKLVQQLVQTLPVGFHCNFNPDKDNISNVVFKRMKKASD